MFVHLNSHKRTFGRGGLANSHRQCLAWTLWKNSNSCGRSVTSDEFWNYSVRHLAGLSETAEFDNMDDTAKQQTDGEKEDADSFFKNKNGYKIFRKYWYPKRKEDEQPRYDIPRHVVLCFAWTGQSVAVPCHGVRNYGCINSL